MPFTMVLIKVGKGQKLKSRQVRKSIAVKLLDRFFDYLSCMEEDNIRWLFNIKNFVYKKTSGLRIGTEKKHAVFTGIISKSDTKRTNYLKLANSKEDNKYEKNFSA